MSLVEQMRRKLNAEPRARRDLIDASYAMALAGDPAHMRMWLDRVDGPVPTKIELTVKSVSELPTEVLLGLLAKLGADQDSIDAEFRDVDDDDSAADAG